MLKLLHAFILRGLKCTAADGAETIATVPVTIGLRDNRYTQITGGLAEGDVVQVGNALPVQSFGPPDEQQAPGN